MNGFVPGALYTDPWVMQAGAPSLATYYNRTDYEHVVSYRQRTVRGTQTYLLRKRSGDNLPFALFGWYMRHLHDKTRHTALGSAQDLEIFVMQQ